MGKRKKSKKLELLEIKHENNNVIESNDNDEIIPKTKKVKNEKKFNKNNESNIEITNDKGDNDSFLSYNLPSVKDNVKIDLSLISNEKLHHLIPKLRRLDDNDKKLLQDHDITIQQGRFTKNENSIICRNWKRYLEDYIIPNKSLLLGHFQYERSKDGNLEIKKSYQKFANETQLWLRLAKDLPNRTIFQIYCRARILLAGLKTAKDFTEDDRQIIIDLYKAYGDHFASFCEEFGYNPNSAREIVRTTIKSNGVQLNRGEWSEDEVKKLKKVVKKLMRKMNLQSYDGIPWTLVSKKLCRSSVQCRQKFFSRSTLLSTIISSQQTQQIEDWNYKLDIAKLIALLKYLNFSDYHLIDWDFIKEKFSTDYFNVILRKWREMRVRIPNHRNLSLHEVLEFLYKRRVIKLFGNDSEKMKEIQEFACTE